MDVTPRMKSLINLVKQAENGEIVLPEFQRPFVWARDDIKDFLISILEGYFIGNFLLLSVDKDNIPFAIKEIKGVNKRPEELKPDYMILDGQQRLTSLFYVFTAPDIQLKGTKYSYKFYLHLNKLINNNVDEAIWSARSDSCSQYDNIDYQFDHNTIPFTRILDWDVWVEEYKNKLRNVKSKDEQLVFAFETLPKWKSYIDAICKKEIPIMEVPKVADDDIQGISEVCSIFEKMNSTGVRLTVFDLLAARLYKYINENNKRISLHELWVHLQALKDEMVAAPVEESLFISRIQVEVA